MELATIRGLTLEQALQAAADPSMVEEMTRLRSDSYDGPHVVPLSGPPTETNLKAWRYDELRVLLENNVMALLRQSALIAYGYDSTSASAPMIQIWPDRWRVLLPDFQSSSATDDTVHIRGILVWSPGSVPDGLPSAAPDQSPPPTPPQKSRVQSLIIIRGDRLIILDGVRKVVPEQPFLLLCMLAEAVINGREFVTAREIEGKFGREPSDLARDLRDAMEGGELKHRYFRDLVEFRRSPSRCGLALDAAKISWRS